MNATETLRANLERRAQAARQISKALEDLDASFTAFSAECSHLSQSPELKQDLGLENARAFAAAAKPVGAFYRALGLSICRVVPAAALNHNKQDGLPIPDNLLTDAVESANKSALAVLDKLQKGGA